MADGPSTITTTPINPPSSACVELDGMRQNHANTIQNTVALRAAHNITGVIPCADTTSEPTALATATPNTNGPINCEMVDNRMARRGVIAWEAIMVATILGAPKIPVRISWTTTSVSRGNTAAKLFTAYLITLTIKSRSFHASTGLRMPGVSLRIC